MSQGRPLRLPGFWSAWALGTGTMVGAGIFTLSGELASVAGPAAAFSYALAGLAALAQAVGIAELAAARPGSGGPYLYTREFLGPRAASVVGWQLWAATVLSASLYAVGFARYLRQLWPQLPELAAAWGCLLAFTGLTVRAPRAAGAVHNLLVVLLLAALVGLVVRGAAALQPSLWEPLAPFGWKPVVQAVPVAFVSYLGFDAVAQAGGLFVQPHRTVPRATLASVFSVAVLYCAAMAVSTGIVPYSQLGRSPTPLADVAWQLAGEAGRLAVTLAGLVATASSASGSLLAAAELWGAMAADGLIPCGLPATPRTPQRSPPGLPSPHRRSGRWPYAVTGLAACAGVLAAAGQGGLGWLARGAGLLHLLPLLALPQAQRAARRRLGRRMPLRIPGGPIWPALSTFALAFILRQASLPELAAALVLSVPGLAAYLRAKGHPPGPVPGPPASPPAARASPSTARRPGRPGGGA